MGRAAAFEFTLHKYGNPSFERTVPKPDMTKASARLDIECGDSAYSVPREHIIRAAHAADVGDVAAILAMGGAYVGPVAK